MQYRNITDHPVEVPRAIGPITVQPGEEVLTSPKFGKPLVEAGKLEAIAPTPAKTTRKTAPKEAAE